MKSIGFSITIKAASNGVIVEIGCRTLVYSEDMPEREGREVHDLPDGGKDQAEATEGQELTREQEEHLVDVAQEEKRARPRARETS